MAENSQDRKASFIVSAEDDTKSTFQEIKANAAEMAGSVEQAGERAARGVSRHYDGALDGFGINVAQYSLLCNLQRLDQPSISSLADAMGLDRSTLGRNLRGAGRRGAGADGGG